MSGVPVVMVARARRSEGVAEYFLDLKLLVKAVSRGGMYVIEGAEVCGACVMMGATDPEFCVSADVVVESSTLRASND